MMDIVAARMAHWVRDLDYDRLPPDVVEMTKRCILDYLGVMARGAGLPQVQAVHGYVHGLGARPRSTIGVKGGGTAPEYAAYVNGTFGHSCEFDDAHILCGHPGVVVIPTAMALAEAQGQSGRALITAVVAGYEMMVQAAACVHYNSLHRGWHSTKVFGVFGAAAAAAKLLDLDESQTVNAFGIAGSEASGTMEYDQSGGEVKRLHAGSCARLGMQSAILAQGGLTGPATIFEGKRGVWKLFGETFEADPESFWAKEFYIRETLFKLWPAVGTVHGAINAAEEIRRLWDVEAADIVAIEAHVSDMTVTHGASIVRPQDCISAQFSLAFSLGLAFAKGANRLGDYLDPANLTDPEVLAVADKVTAIERPTAPGASHLGALLVVRLKDGRVLEYDVPTPRGHPDNPPSGAEIEAKFRGLAGEVFPQRQVDAIVDTVMNLETLADVGDLARLTVAGQ